MNSPPVGADFIGTVMPCVDLVHNLARRLVRRPGDAEDLVQDTLTRAWEAWTGGTRPESVPGWLSTICLNLARDQARRAARRRETGWEHVPEPAADVDVAGAAIDRVHRGQIEAALWALPEAQRVAIVLMDICGLSAAEVGAVIDAPRGTVLARVHRGRKALAAEVARRARPPGLSLPGPARTPGPAADPGTQLPPSDPQRAVEEDSDDQPPA